MRAAIGTRQQQITDGKGDTAIAVVERVQRDEPQMAESRSDEWRPMGPGTTCIGTVASSRQPPTLILASAEIVGAIRRKALCATP